MTTSIQAATKTIGMSRPPASVKPTADLQRADIEVALKKASVLSRRELLDSSGATASVKYFLVSEGREYDAKAIIQLAWNIRHPGQSCPAFRGDRSHVAEPLRVFGFDVVNYDDRGHLPGIAIGSHFADRRALYDANVHRALQAGIVGKEREGAESIVVSGGYADDRDFGDVIIYTGHGGNDQSTKQQIADQQFTAGNLALATSCDRGLPVRVIRGSGGDPEHSPSAGFRYDGLYTVSRYWREIGIHGFLIWRYELHEIRMTQAQPVDEQSAPDGNEQPERRQTAPRSQVVRDVRLATWVKEKHNFSCQLCGERIETPTGGYAEAAHITPLGNPHNGPDQTSNLLCLCPNCHIRFDKHARFVDDSDTVIETATNETVGTLRRHPAHRIDNDHLAAHRKRAFLTYKR